MLSVAGLGSADIRVRVLMVRVSTGVIGAYDHFAKLSLSPRCGPSK